MVTMTATFQTAGEMERAVQALIDQGIVILRKEGEQAVTGDEPQEGQLTSMNDVEPGRFTVELLVESSRSNMAVDTVGKYGGTV